ncbi:MAG: type I 3-dehydroquinate dehydratase, partial [Alistipes sp.]|nr:type I 3-dehydroquinate dehydratase [Candidatus Minthomonas equi]
MICITICDFGYDACRHALRRCERYLHTYPDLVVEIRLDLCGLNEEENQRLFCDSKVPLIATCRRRSSDLYFPAVLSGASYIDIDGIQSNTDIQHILQELEGHKVQKILSYQNFQKTPALNELISYFENGVSLGADIIKITTSAQNTEDTEKLLSLYILQR